MRLPAALLALIVLSLPGAAQDAPRQLTAGDYARSERFLGRHTSPLVYGASVNPRWLADGRFWYRNTIPGGAEFVLVDPSARTRKRAFDHTRLAEALNAVQGPAPADRTFSELDLPVRDLTFTGEPLRDEAISLLLNDGSRYVCVVTSYLCESAGASPNGGASPGRASPGASPDGSMVAFIRDHDLWVRDVETGLETRLTLQAGFDVTNP